MTNSVTLVRWTSCEKREIARDVVRGLSLEEIAAKHGRSLRALRERISSDEELQGYLEDLQQELDLSVVKKVVESRTKSMESLAQAAPLAAQKLVEILEKGETDSIRLKAAVNILDRLGVSLDVKRIQQVVEQRRPLLTGGRTSGNSQRLLRRLTGLESTA
jgi:DNA-binding phage protein